MRLNSSKKRALASSLLTLALTVLAGVLLVRGMVSTTAVLYPDIGPRSAASVQAGNDALNDQKDQPALVLAPGQASTIADLHPEGALLETGPSLTGEGSRGDNKPGAMMRREARG